MQPQEITSNHFRGSTQGVVAEQGSLNTYNWQYHAQNANERQYQCRDDGQRAIAVRHYLRQEEDSFKNNLLMGMISFMYMAMGNYHSIYHMRVCKQGDASEMNCKQQQKEIPEKCELSFFFCQYLDNQ